MKEAHGESVAVSTQPLRNVAITQQQVAPVVSVMPPPPPKEVDDESMAELAKAPRNVSITQQQVASVASVVSPPPSPRASAVPKKDIASKAETPEKITKVELEKESLEATKEVLPADVEMENADVEMENADEEADVVSYTPPKPIQQMTVSILREELKKLGLSIKGLKAELVKRLKEAAGEA